MNPTADTLATEFTFRGLFGDQTWARLASAAERVDLSAGTVLIRRGDQEMPLYVIEEGTFEVVDARSSPETVLSVLGAGHVLGDMSFVDRAPASAEVRARTHGRALAWPREALSDLLEADPALALAFYQALATIVVERSRNLMSAAVVGGFGLNSHRERVEALELARQAETLAMDLLAVLEGASAAEDPMRAAALAEALTALCRWFTVAADEPHTEEIGDRLRALLELPLASSAIASAMLERQEGAPAGPTLFRHVLAGQPRGRDAAGTLLDAALLALPTFRGWRWRDRALATALSEALPRAGARVLSVSLTGTPTSEAQLAVLRERAGHVTSVQLAPQPEIATAPAGVTRTTVVADLPSLLRGTGPRVGGGHHVVIVDRVSDVLPDEILRSLLAWARLQLAPRGWLVVGHAVPADDVAMLDHLLRWPALPRRPAAVLELLPRGGRARALTPVDDEAAALVIWEAGA